jgi:hypothetical protein
VPIQAPQHPEALTPVRGGRLENASTDQIFREARDPS